MALVVADLMSRLPARFTLVQDDAGLPVRIDGPGRSHPVLAVEPDLPASELRADPDLERLLSQGLPGLVVMRGDTVLGVLQAADIVEFGRLNMSRTYREADGQDAALNGEARPMRRRVLVRCRQCRRTNSYDYLLPTARTMCAGGHVLDADMS
ncbi:hypothetical protein [Streptomyces sp. NPDC002088]|uniref:hypothetical protein n=1 Tax=Streptomyces sp. NPDC002088 TaxID=3154665 RepID=UPI00331A7E0A